MSCKIVMRQKQHTDWIGREHFRSQLELAAQKVVFESDKLSHLDNRTYVNGVVKAMKLLPCNPIFDEVGQAYRNLNELTRIMVFEHKIHIDLIRTITGPIISKGNPAEIALTQRGLQRAKLEQ